MTKLDFKFMNAVQLKVIAVMIWKLKTIHKMELIYTGAKDILISTTTDVNIYIRFQSFNGTYLSCCSNYHFLS